MIPVTQPLLPPLEEFNEYLKKIWDNKWLTNNGQFHQELEKALCEYLGVKHLCLFSNATLALITALQALKITGEVITTPYSFVATTHSLWWNNIKPVFVDVEPGFFNIDPAKIEAAITPQTTAIMPVHVYGNSCHIEEIQRIADVYGLHVIYDAAHAFGVKYKHTPIVNFGDLSVLSFHATKVYSTIEGGAIICHDEKTKQRIDKLKNFGFADEVTVVAPGINAKLNEIQAAFGLLQLKHIDGAIAKRKEINNIYRKGLAGVKGIGMLPESPHWETTYAYFPVLVNKEEYGMTRDELYELLKTEDIYARRYFYPLISNFPTYKGLPSSGKDNLPVANSVAEKILCLPIYPDLALDQVERIIRILRKEK